MVNVKSLVNPYGLTSLRFYCEYVLIRKVFFSQLFLKNNQNGAETTRLDALGLHGIPISVTNMGDFARVRESF